MTPIGPRLPLGVWIDSKAGNVFAASVSRFVSKFRHPVNSSRFHPRDYLPLGKGLETVPFPVLFPLVSKDTTLGWRGWKRCQTYCASRPFQAVASIAVLDQPFDFGLLGKFGYAALGDIHFLRDFPAGFESVPHQIQEDIDRLTF